MPAVQPGDYITAKCGRCDDITGHVVMIVVGGEILRVECKACGSVHKFRAQKPVGAKRETTSGFKHVKAGQDRDQAVEKGRRVAPSPTVARPAASRSKAAVPKSKAKYQTAWEEAMRELAHTTPKEYSMNESFEIQSLVLHPVFGKGVVLGVQKPDKMDVLFEEGMKTLRCKV